MAFNIHDCSNQIPHSCFRISVLDMSFNCKWLAFCYCFVYAAESCLAPINHNSCWQKIFIIVLSLIILTIALSITLTLALSLPLRLLSLSLLLVALISILSLALSLPLALPRSLELAIRLPACCSTGLA